MFLSSQRFVVVAALLVERLLRAVADDGLDAQLALEHPELELREVTNVWEFLPFL